MNSRELILPIYLKNKKAVRSFTDDAVISEDPAALATAAENSGADAILIFDLSRGDPAHDAAVGTIRQISRSVDLPLYGGGSICRMEDVKKLIYAGCRKVFLNYAKAENRELTEEAGARFGRERILACVRTDEELNEASARADLLDGVILPDLMLASGAVSLSVFDTICCNISRFEPDAAAALMAEGHVTGVFCTDFADETFSFMEAKDTLREKGVNVNTWEPSMTWADVKPDANGLLPVVVQDYKTLEVLMVAYMNEESFAETIRTGKMTYFSRSRQKLWVKGETSGHFQYVRALAIDCDNDTLLAKVMQIGAACHTGNRSCFYRTILRKDYDSTNPMKVFEDVYAVIEDRKIHPKEGSYTNYLFDKGIDKILKKVGEETSEVIIAAKNPDPDEVIYEISDLLYHIMVLMSEKGLTWEDITEELARR